jgi:hypothetical protein
MEMQATLAAPDDARQELNRAGPQFAKLQLCTFAKSALLRVALDAVDLADEIEHFLRDGSGFQRLEEVAADMR